MKKQMRNSTAYLCRGAMIAALYVALTLLSAAMGLSSGPIQFRLSEALCILPVFTSAAVPGLTVGCLIANLVTGAPVWDVLLGSFATLLGAFGARALRGLPYLASLPAVLANVAIVPPVLVYAYGVGEGWLFIAATVAMGELVCCTGLGSLLIAGLSKYRTKLFE